MPQKYGLDPGVKEDVAQMQKRANISLILPDKDSILAIGKNPYDPTHAASSAKENSTMYFYSCLLTFCQ